MLNGKTAVVTGAAKGIGKAIAVAFAKEGCNIVLNYHSSLCRFREALRILSL